MFVITVGMEKFLALAKNRVDALFWLVKTHPGGTVVGSEDALTYTTTNGVFFARKVDPVVGEVI